MPNAKNLAFDTLNVDALITLWEKNVQTHAKEKDSRLHFYFHNTLSGKNPSAVEVAEASITKKDLKPPPSLWVELKVYMGQLANKK